MWSRCKSIVGFGLVMLLVTLTLTVTWLGILICFAYVLVVYLKDRAKQPSKTSLPPLQQK